MNKDLPKWLTTTMLVAIALLAFWVFTNRDRMDVYGTHFRETSPAVTTRFAALSVAMDEAALLRHFEGVPLRCVTQQAGADSLGERACFAQIDKADGDAALMLVAFLSKGQLVRVMVQIPWWTHGAWKSRLNASYGTPEPAGRVSMLGGPVWRWKIPNGQVEFNRDRGFNPLDWSVVLWTGQPSRKP